MLGLFPEWQGRTQHTTLNIGDSLLIFPDGLIEAANAAGEQFGTDRLIHTWRNARQCNSGDLVRSLNEAILCHSDGALCNDRTILALRGRPAHASSTRDTLTGNESAIPVACCR